MSNELKTIHEFDFTLICNYFKGLKRQGPGSPEVTQKALSFTNELSDNARIADIGCGTGGQTMALANYTKGQITGIDLFPDFIEIFNRNAIEAHCEDRVKGIVGSMDALPFQEEELDLIWSEGAIYNIGFERGMNEWNKFLKKNGIRTRVKGKISDGKSDILESIRKGYVNYVINTRDVDCLSQQSDGYLIRRCAVENNVTMFTALDTVRVLLDVLEEITITISTIDGE